MGDQPPARIAAVGIERAGISPSPPATAAAGTVLHFGFGAAVGALFGLGYALLVYAGSYAGWLPAVGIMPAPARDRPGRQPVLVAAHVVFGAALAVLVGALVPPRKR